MDASSRPLHGLTTSRKVSPWQEGSPHTDNNTACSCRAKFTAKAARPAVSAAVPLCAQIPVATSKDTGKDSAPFRTRACTVKSRPGLRFAVGSHTPQENGRKNRVLADTPKNRVCLRFCG